MASLFAVEGVGVIRAWLLALLLLAGTQAAAQQQCTLYRVVISGGVFGPEALTPEGAGAAWVPPDDGPSGCQGGGTWTRHWFFDHYDNGTAYYSSTIETTGGCSNPGSVQNFQKLVQEFTGDCPEPEACSGLASEGVGDTFTTDTFPGSGVSYCNPISHCKMAVTTEIDFGGATVYKVTHTDQDCSSVSDPAPTDLDTTETCATAGGEEFCFSKNGTNCGHVNDEFVCLPQTEQDGCQVFASGARVCGTAAPTPPVPDSGTPGTPATPDTVINITENSSTTTVNYFNSSTVGASARNPGTSGDNPYDGTDDGSGATGGTGSGSGSGSDNGCPEGDCTGVGEGAEMGEVCTFQECTQEFFNRVKAAPLVEGVLTAGASMPTGSCPNWTLEAFNEDYLLSAPMCEIWDEVSPLLSAIFLVIWAWVATRIVLSA